MLYVFLGTHKNSVHYVSDYFNAVYEPDWLNNDFVKRAIQVIDKSEHIDGDYIKDYQEMIMMEKKKVKVY